MLASVAAGRLERRKETTDCSWPFSFPGRTSPSMLRTSWKALFCAFAWKMFLMSSSLLFTVARQSPETSMTPWMSCLNSGIQAGLKAPDEDFSVGSPRSCASASMPWLKALSPISSLIPNWASHPVSD